MAAPRPVGRPPANPRFGGVLSDVPQAAVHMPLALHDVAVVARSEEMTILAARAIDAAGEGFVDRLHSSPEIRLRRSNQEMQMVRQQAEREHAPLATTDLASQQSEI